MIRSLTRSTIGVYFAPLVQPVRCTYQTDEGAECERLEKDDNVRRGESIVNSRQDPHSKKS